MNNLDNMVSNSSKNLCVTNQDETNKILNREIKYLKGVGPKRSELYEKLGVDRVYALLRYYPRTYIDLSKTYMINSAPKNENVPICAKVYSKNGMRTAQNKMQIYKALASDGVNNMVITFFNNKYIYDGLVVGKEYIFYGKLSSTVMTNEMKSPIIIDKNDKVKIKGIYRLTKNISSNMIRQNVFSAFSLVKGSLNDPLPQAILSKNQLCGLEYAIEKVHFPQTNAELEHARKRLIFEELLTLNLGLSMLKKNTKEKSTYKITCDDLSEFHKLLPFILTDAQQNVISECISDMKGTSPMARLVQGDVGSGKTMIAAACAYSVIKSGFQCAMMAPTEILATQHYKNLSSLFDKCGFKIGLLTGSMTKKQKDIVKNNLQSGEIDFIIGTHAIIQNDVAFKNLALVITDEQHRFGVSQRAMLAEKSTNPHVMVMSATPIPRSLALVIYGDLDISIVNQLPANRLKIETYFIDSAKRQRMFGFIKKHLDAGRQAYIVCPSIDESELDLESVTLYREKIKKTVLKDYNIEVLHGKLKASEKDEIMARFSSGETDILISTTVIEVGVDVPNAVIMTIESAERFGLSQLHQLRGRVGRGIHQSYCILISDDKNPDTVARLKTMCKTSDGFEVANEDLKLRGPGDFFGNKQHGLPELKIADMMNDLDLLKLSQQVCGDILKSDPTLSSPENSGLKNEINILLEKLTPGRIS